MSTALRHRMTQDLQLAGLSPRTQDAYTRAVRLLADHYHTPPDRLSEAQVTDGTLRLLREAGLLHALAQARGQDDGQRPVDAASVVSLNLLNTKVTDAGLKELKGLPNLQTLDLRDTRVTAAGVRAFQALRPALSCKTQINP